MSWAVGSSGGTRPPRPLLEVTEQLAQAAAADFTTRLAELVIDDSVGGPTGVSAPTAHVDSADGIRARSASNAGGGIAESEMEKAEAEELAVLRSRMTALASVFADRFNTSVDEQVMALWNKRDDVADGGELGTLASGLPLKKVRHYGIHSKRIAILGIICKMLNSNTPLPPGTFKFWWHGD